MGGVRGVLGEAAPEAALPRALASKRHRAWLALLPLALYAAGLNPFFLPGTYDNIVYYSGAVSLAEEGSFKFRGQYIVDWPPGFSALLAAPFMIGLQSIGTAKACVVLCAAGGLFLALRLFEREQRPVPALTVGVFALLPSSFSMGTRIMSEWPYFLASMLVLRALQRLPDGSRPDPRLGGGKGWGAAVAAGFLLGAASLTKFTGVLLGAAILAQAIEKWRRSEKGLGWRAILPELTAALIGAALFLLWKAKIQWQLDSGAAAAPEYYRFGWFPYHLNRFDPLGVPGRIGDLFFHSDAVLGWLGWEGWAGRAVCATPGVVVLIGMLARLLSGQSSPGDWYVFSVLALFSAAGDNQQTRYLMPVAPFLISYGFLGCARMLAACQAVARGAVAGRAFGRPWHAAWPCRAAAAFWILVLAGSAFHLLFVGNLTGTHRGLFFPVSRTPETFYRGFWLDLFQACQRVRQEPAPGGIAVIGGEDKYVTAFTGRRWLDFRRADNFAFLLVLDRTGLPREQMDALNLRCLKRYDSMVLYQKSGVHRDPEPGRLATLPE